MIQVFDVGLAGPYKSLLAAYIAQQYGKQIDPAKTDWAMKMLQAQSIESVGTTKYPCHASNWLQATTMGHTMMCFTVADCQYEHYWQYRL